MSCVWSVTEMLVKPVEDGKPDVVVTVKFSCTASADGKTAAYNGSIGFDAPGDPFTPYSQLTQEQVLNWAFERGFNKDQIEAVVLMDLDALINPPVVNKPLPWA